MTDLWIIAAVLAAIVVLAAAFDLFWLLVDVVHPLVHQAVPLNDIHDHIRSIFRRGLNRSRMIITNEQSGMRLHLRKTYVFGKEGIVFHAVVPRVSPPASGVAETIKTIESMGLRYDMTYHGRKSVDIDIDCDASLEVANALADLWLTNIVGASDSSTFRVRVKGRIFPIEGYIGGETTASDMRAMYWMRAYDTPSIPPRPYKWAHYYILKGTWGKSLGVAIGRIAAWLFPPRKGGPGIGP